MALMRNVLAMFTIPAAELGIGEHVNLDLACLYGDQEVFLDHVRRLEPLGVRIRTDRAARAIHDQWSTAEYGDVLVVNFPARYFREVVTRLGRCLEVQKVHYLDPGWDRKNS